MLTVQEALAEILNEVHPLPASTVPLANAYGLVIAEEVASDVDSPPFDKALMDGYAVRCVDVADGVALLRCIEEVTAGHVATKSVSSGEATRIMTGAPIPDGADTVVPVEATRFDETAGTVRISTEPLDRGKHVLLRGTSRRAGERVMTGGQLLRPQELGALAEIGKAEISAVPRPRVAVLATGDELVPYDRQLQPGQIRNSNEIMLLSQIRRAGGVPIALGIARDERRHLAERVAAGLDCDMLLLSGGVSAGKLDLVPSVLAESGVKEVFHHVAVKPGKPVWFGVRIRLEGSSGRRPTYVFGLPGNPVSSMVCFELFARTAIRRLRGIEPSEPKPVRARLDEETVVRGRRPVFHPAQLTGEGSDVEVTPVAWQGSSDLQATVSANAMAHFPRGDETYRAGEQIDVYRWDSETH